MSCFHKKGSRFEVHWGVCNVVYDVTMDYIGVFLAYQVGTLNKLDGDVKDKITLCTNLAERLIAKKLTREAYLDQDGKAQKALLDLKEKIVDLTDNM